MNNQNNLPTKRIHILHPPGEKIAFYCNYEIVDSKGNPFAGGSQSIKNVIKQTA